MDNEPIDHDMEWEDGPGLIHFNCRSVESPWIKGEQVGGERPSVGAGENYKRGDNVTRTGRVRPLTARTVDKGTYKPEIKTTRTTYEGWLRSQPTDFVADALGSAQKAKAFKGGMPLKQVTTKPLGTPMTIGELT